MAKSKTPQNAPAILPCFAVLEDMKAPREVPTTLILTDSQSFDAKKHKEHERDFELAKKNGFSGKAGQSFIWPGPFKGGVGVVGVGQQPSIWDLAGLPGKLPADHYALLDTGGKRPLAHTNPELLEKLALGWALGSYQFNGYKHTTAPAKNTAVPQLVLPRAMAERVSQAAAAQYMARDLINTPAADLGPRALCEAGAAMGARYGATAKLIEGKALEKGFPAIHTVGKAADLKPCLLDLTWGDPKHPEIVLIGKGVTFDSGGLDIKPTDGMLDMKKDMGGAATALAVAERIMQEKLPVRLRVIIPSAENAIAGNAFRPRDIIRTRSGKTVEVTNTDAEGRLVLCDALAYALEGKQPPGLVIDFATLTGAARVALGVELPALFSNDDKLARDILEAGKRQEDPLWQLPLWTGYEGLLDSKTADMVNSAPGSFAGAITAALFLNKFVPANVSWAHVDTFAWHKSSKPGRPEGGDPLAMRAVFDMVQKRYAPRKP